VGVVMMSDLFIRLDDQSHHHRRQQQQEIEDRRWASPKRLQQSDVQRVEATRQGLENAFLHTISDYSGLKSRELHGFCSK
jgi:hypothetical protein